MKTAPRTVGVGGRGIRCESAERGRAWLRERNKVQADGISVRMAEHVEEAPIPAACMSMHTRMTLSQGKRKLNNEAGIHARPRAR
eukprot:2376103-Pleurochrysis_carterae.AAC.1